MKTIKLLLLLVCLTEVTYSQNSDDLVIAKRFKINSTVLGEERTFFVSTPYGYNDSKESYQVLYVLDGASDMIGFVKYASGYGVCPPLIVVTIDEVNSTRDMFPSRPLYKRGTQPTTAWYHKTENNELKTYMPDEKVGEADNFLSFIENKI